MKRPALLILAAAALALCLLPLLFPLEGQPGPGLVVAVGRFHILVLHFPIALLLTALLMEILAMREGGAKLRQPVRFIGLLALLSMFATCVLGLMYARGEGISGDLVNRHMWGGISATVLVTIAFILREKQLRAAYLSVLSAGILVMTLGAHYGASMIHGEDFLVEHLPGWRGGGEHEITWDSPVYGDLVRPILEQNCYSCHSSKSQKGGFRTDSIEALLVGGNSGQAGVVVGDSAGSELVRRIRLPRSHDDVMPPVEETPLGSRDVALLSWWVDGGASAEVTINELSLEDFPESVDDALTDLMRATPTELLDATVFADVSSQVKTQFGIDVISRSQDLADGVYISSQNAIDPIPTAAVEALLPLASHVDEINFWNRQFEAGTLQGLASFTNLRQLNLSETDVRPDDLASIAELHSLRQLNLAGTNVDDDAIQALGSMPRLRHLMLHGSAVTPDGVARLLKLLRHCEVLAFVDVQEVEGIPLQMDSSTP